MKYPKGQAQRLLQSINQSNQENDMSVTTRRAALSTIAAAATAMSTVALPAMAGEPDPIFGLIEARKATAAASEYAYSDDKLDAATGEDNEAVIAILRTPPTTLAGVAAVLRYVDTPMYDDDPTESVLSYSLEGDPANEWTQAAQNFLPMIAETIERLSKAVS
jgi:hypothetical protein